jgi:hypothetical protein
MFASMVQNNSRRVTAQFDPDIESAAKFGCTNQNRHETGGQQLAVA